MGRAPRRSADLATGAAADPTIARSLVGDHGSGTGWAVQYRQLDDVSAPALIYPHWHQAAIPARFRGESDRVLHSGS
jgi:hypothetical protein